MNARDEVSPGSARRLRPQKDPTVKRAKLKPWKVAAEPELEQVEIIRRRGGPHQRSIFSVGPSPVQLKPGFGGAR